MIREILHRLGVVGATAGDPAHAAIERAGPADPSGIPGGSGARELRMLPVDGALDQLEGDWIVQLKVDGIGGVYVPGAGIVTSNGVPMDCALHCVPGLERMTRLYPEPMVFDGEYAEEGGFNATNSAFRKGRGLGVFWVYDALPFDQWVRNRCTAPIEVRLAHLMRALPHSESVFVGALQSWKMSPVNIQAKALELWGLGYEGLVCKRPGSLYRRERSPDWRRIKREATHDCQIVDVLDACGATVRNILVRGPEGSPIKLGVPESFPDRDRLRAGAWIEMSFQPVVGGGVRAAKLRRMRPDKEGGR